MITRILAWWYHRKWLHAVARDTFGLNPRWYETNRSLRRRIRTMVELPLRPGTKDGLRRLRAAGVSEREIVSKFTPVGSPYRSPASRDRVTDDDAVLVRTAEHGWLAHLFRMHRRPR